MLVVEDIRVAYGKTHALHGVSFQVNQGELVTFIGANGAGKSTTLRTISGVLHPLTGSIFYKGQEIHKKNPEEIVRLGIVHCPEGRRIWPKMTVSENLTLGGYILPKNEITDMKEQMYNYFPILKERQRQLAGSMSGGEQQMLAIARALMARPEFMLFDEPSLGLAPKIVEDVMEIIHNINKKQHTTVLLVEQNANMALSIADRAYVIESGYISLEGKASAIKNDEHVRQAYLGK